MAVIVDPFVVPIPEKYTADSEEFAYHDYMVKTIQQIIERIGGPGSRDAIAELEIGELYEEGTKPSWASALEKRIVEIEVDLDMVSEKDGAISSIKARIDELDYEMSFVNDLAALISRLQKDIEALEIETTYI